MQLTRTEQPSAAKWNILGTNDAYFDSLVGSGTAWATWSPSLVNLSGGTQTEAKYTQLGKIVFIRFKYTLGGAGMGTGPTFSLPVTAAAANNERAEFFSTFQDTGVGLYYGSAFLASTTTVGAYAHNASGTYITGAGVSSTVPFTWGNTDIWFVKGFYEAA